MLLINRFLTILFIINLYSMNVYSMQSHDHIVYPPHRIKPHTSLLTPSGLSPTQISTAYGLNFVPYEGEGQTIAIVDAYDDPSIESDLGVFDSTFSLPDCTTANGCFTKIYASGSQPAQDNNWDLEIALDVEWAHAVAPKAKILLVEAADANIASLFTAIDVAVANGAKTISMSWGGSEFSGQTAFDTRILNHVKAGVTFFAASGDNGYGILYPASCRYVIAVGGTSLAFNGSGDYSTETAWSGSGGGLSRYEPESATQINFSVPKANSKRAVPDVSWNADPNSGYSVYDTANNGWMVVGGTSAASPQWAALLSLAKSGTHKNLTSVYSALYAIGKSNYKYYYNDISSGTNGSCGYYCTARVGYDYVTGIGSPQALYVINGLMYNGFT
jgi:subtilase family serine protease